MTNQPTTALSQNPISEPNTQPGSESSSNGKVDELSELAGVGSDDENAKLTLALSQTQEALAGVRDARKEERIGWIVVCVILFNMMFLLQANNWSGPLIIGFLEIGALLVLAKRMGVQEFYELLAASLGRLGSALVNPEDRE